MSDSAPLLAAALGTIGVLAGVIVFLAKRKTRTGLTREDLTAALTAALESQVGPESDSHRQLRAVVDAMREDLARVVTQAKRLFQFTDEHGAALKDSKEWHDEIKDDLRVIRRDVAKLFSLKDDIDVIRSRADEALSGLGAMRREQAVNKPRAS